VSTAPSGEQFEISAGAQRATIVEVGGGVREYSVEERAVLDPYPVDQMADGAHGAPLIPWPNRLADGRYRFAGADHQVALTEPEKNNAIHGFLRWRPWTAAEREPSRIVMTTRLYPLMGYPFVLDVAITYSLSEDGLEVTTTARNVGGQPCPYACGHHPYLSPGKGLIDDCTIELDAKTRVRTDEERQLPTGREPVVGTPFDFRSAKPLGDTRLDDAFTDLGRDASGRASARLRAADGSCAELWVDESYSFVELYTGDSLSPTRARRGLGAEPMTCPPNAFQSGEALVHLDPGASFSATWGVRLV
jgi:aldose 1-epimerase